MSGLLPAENLFRDAGKDFKTRLEIHGVLDIEVRTVMTVVLAAVEEERGVPAMRHHGAREDRAVFRGLRGGDFLHFLHVLRGGRGFRARCFVRACAAMP